MAREWQRAKEAFEERLAASEHVYMPDEGGAFRMSFAGVPVRVRPEYEAGIFSVAADTGLRAMPDDAGLLLEACMRAAGGFWYRLGDFSYDSSEKAVFVIEGPLCDAEVDDFVLMAAISAQGFAEKYREIIEDDECRAFSCGMGGESAERLFRALCRAVAERGE